LVQLGVVLVVMEALDRSGSWWQLVVCSVWERVLYIYIYKGFWWSGLSLSLVYTIEGLVRLKNIERLYN
jgi:hypothetical protein